MSRMERKHTFILPGNTGDITLSLHDSAFPDLSNEELYKLGRVIRDFLYGLMLEDKDNRENFLNIFNTVIKDSLLTIEDKDLGSLLKYSVRLFKLGDYENSLFLGKYILAKINKIIDDKIAHNSKKIDKEIIKLQISTLNFISYLFAKLHRNIDYGLKLSRIASKLLEGFNNNMIEVLSMKAAILDTMGALYIEKREWEKAIEILTRAHEADKELLEHGRVDEIGFRVTCSNLGYAIVCYYEEMLNNESINYSIGEVESRLRESEFLFNMVKIDQSPQVPEHKIKDLELLAAIRRTKEGLKKIEKLRIKIQRRFI